MTAEARSDQRPPRDFWKSLVMWLIIWILLCTAIGAVVGMPEFGIGAGIALGVAFAFGRRRRRR